MTRIYKDTGCGNSPKNHRLQEFVVAIAKADVSGISKAVTDEIRWAPVGRKPVAGREAFTKAITRYGPATELTIEHVISHGKVGAVNGIVEFGEKRRAFCYVFEFSNAKGTEVGSITSYSIPLA